MALGTGGGVRSFLHNWIIGQLGVCGVVLRGCSYNKLLCKKGLGGLIFGTRGCVRAFGKSPAFCRIGGGIALCVLRLVGRFVGKRQWAKQGRPGQKV